MARKIYVLGYETADDGKGTICAVPDKINLTDSQKKEIRKSIENSFSEEFENEADADELVDFEKTLSTLLKGEDSSWVNYYWFVWIKIDLIE